MENKVNSNIRRKRLTAIVGHYGSGKTEFAVNMALQTVKAIEPEKDTLYLVDLDIVNPYFRSREREDILTEKGIRVLSSASDFRGVDLPYMPPEMAALFAEGEEGPIGILDIGGDAAGARVLTRYSHDLRKACADVWCVINANRPMTKTPKDAIGYINDIEGTSQVRITGLVNNTHLVGDTTVRDIIDGARLTKEVAEITGIPLIGSTVRTTLIDQLMETKEDVGTLIPIEIYLKKPWE